MERSKVDTKKNLRCIIIINSIKLLSHQPTRLSRTSCADVVAPSEKKGSTIQYGYRNWGTHARVFSKTLAHGNSKNEIR